MQKKPTKPLFLQIYETLKSEIDEQKFPDMMLPSERELSARFNVERMTIRRSLEILVDENYIEKIPGFGTRIRHGSDVYESAGLNNTIVFLLPGGINVLDKMIRPFNAILFATVENECRKRNYGLIYKTIENGDDIVGVLDNLKCKGVLLVSQIEQRILKDVDRYGIPAVVVNNKSDLFASVIADNENGAYEAVKHLIKQGHKDIAMICGLESYTTNQERLKGYQKALTEAGIECPGQYIKNGDWTFESGYQIMKEFLSGDRIPTAVFAANDMMATGAMSAIREAGIKIPQDINLIGFDDLEQCKYLYVRLASVRMNIEGMGRVACQFLFSEIRTKQKTIARVVLPCDLELRESVNDY